MLSEVLFDVFIKRNIINEDTCLTIGQKRGGILKQQEFIYSGHKKVNNRSKITIESQDGTKLISGLGNVLKIDRMTPEQIALAYEYDLNGNRTFSFFENKKAGKPKRNLMSFEYMFYILNRKLDFTLDECMNFLGIDEDQVTLWLNNLEPTPQNVLNHAALIDKYVELCKYYKEKKILNHLNNHEKLTQTYLKLLKKHKLDQDIDAIPSQIAKKLYVLKEKY